MRRPVLPILALLVTGCVDQLAQRQAFLTQFVGHPDSDLVQQPACRPGPMRRAA